MAAGFAVGHVSAYSPGRNEKAGCERRSLKTFT